MLSEEIPACYRGVSKRSRRCKKGLERFTGSEVNISEMRFEAA